MDLPRSLRLRLPEALLVEEWGSAVAEAPWASRGGEAGGVLPSSPPLNLTVDTPSKCEKGWPGAGSFVNDDRRTIESNDKKLGAPSPDSAKSTLKLSNEFLPPLAKVTTRRMA